MKHIPSIFLLFFFSGLVVSVNAQKLTTRQLKEENSYLKKENKILYERLDSVRKELKHKTAILDAIYSNQKDDKNGHASELDIDLSDSLLHVWYMNQGHIAEQSIDMETVRFTSNVSDEEFCRRLQAMNSFIPIQFNDVVKNFCILYSEKMPQAMGRVMGLSRYYWPLVDEVFSTAGLPLELRTLVIIESMMKPDATSRVGAKGLWQFMYNTGKGFGLTIDSWMDERMDPFKSTVAAAQYLKNAYNIFGDWNLAIASYNCGAANVSKAIRRCDGKADFWEIYQYLPKETRSYVPAFIGALYATHYYREYGLVPESDAFPIHVDTLHVHKNLHFEQLVECVGIDKATIAELNPQYLHEILPGDDRLCVLRLPSEKVGAFISAGDSLYRYKADIYFNPVEIKKIKEAPENRQGVQVVHKVRSGDVLGKIAIRYGVSVTQIKKWNSLKSDKIRVGQKLIIYKKK